MDHLSEALMLIDDTVGMKLNNAVEQTIYDEQCPIFYTMNIFNHKWKIPILWRLLENEGEPIRYNELRRRVTGVTPIMLTKCLRELERDGIINRKQIGTVPPLTVEYSLTPRGESLMPALRSLYRWGEEQMR